MKAILMSIKPKYVSMILNKVKTIEVRKRFPSDYVGWVYIYVTHGRHLLDLRKVDTKDNFRLTTENKSNTVSWSYPPILNGKVVARFWCDKVEEIIYGITNDTRNCPKEDQEFDLQTETLNDKELKEQSCLSYNELHNYFEKEFNTSDNYFKTVFGKAIHITKLEIFDKPKEISEFSSKIEKTCICFNQFVAEGTQKIPLNRAPQSWCYVEV